ncbi:hypothetical protein BJ508DRAFT_358276 [Ascobolus immersus RN42]|uniref:Uncharacterized protein n=1 Tax=Ascobolus immersus RN42 TaxID=1160509 RepID=A0A3N4IJ37_ASCIM|nr:hypothetical protein BJ508DRAFT_358276 [Ascobolus immersus RN42]
MPLSKEDKEQATTAAKLAMWGAAVGAAKWSAISAVGAVVGMQYSPLYRGLTFQFKVFLCMIPPIFGGSIEAEKRFIDYEWRMRAQKKLEKARAELKVIGDEEEAEFLKQHIKDLEGRV